MKILGVERQSIAMPNKIQPNEHSMGGGMDGASHNSSQSER